MKLKTIEELSIDIPDRLYHYTSIDSLAMILSTRKLRFTRLDLVNDPEEAAANDLPISRELVFATCWTGVEEESLPMWKMYTPISRGVRISMPWDFLEHERRDVTGKPLNYMFSLHEYLQVERENGNTMHTRLANGPYKIYYAKPYEDHRSSCITTTDTKRLFSLTDLGTIKKSYWEFEQEWRYKLYATASTALSSPDDEYCDLIEQMYHHSNHVITKHLFVPISETALQSMQIMIGPSADPAIEVIVRSLLKSCDIDAKIDHSTIKVNW